MTPQEIDRIENAIRHIQTAVDVDPWACDIAVGAMKTQLSREDTTSDLISRQAAIDAFMTATSDGDKAEWCRWVLKQLPSAQPEPCEDAVSREEAKWVVFCNRDHVEDQANAIDALPPVTPKAEQPDMSGYSDKLWKAAYERGKTEAQQRWIPFKTRPLTEEEKEEHPEWDCILDCKLPDDGQAILVSIDLRGHECVQYDEFYSDDGSYLDSGYEIGKEATAWMPLPKPYRAERRTDETD